MHRFKDISIRNKLIIIQVATAIISVSICCVIFVFNDIKTFKKSSVIHIYTIAEIVGVNSVSPLLFIDQDAAKTILLNLNSNASILNAVIFDKTGKEFSEYTKKGEEAFLFPIPDGTIFETQKFFEKKFIVSYQIFYKKEFLGTIMLRAELIDLNTIIYNYIKIAILILIASTFLAFIISAFFQRIITNRLISLVSKTKEVAETNNYSIRVSIEGKDEIGILSEGFNNMLEQIEKTAKELELSLSLMLATIESTADGILVVDNTGKISILNQQFRKLWKIPDEILKTKDDNKVLAYGVGQIKDPDKFLNKVKELYANPELESFDVIEMKDGTTFERYSKPQRNTQKEIVGRVWSFRDVTIRNRAVEELRQLNEQLEQRVKERTAALTETQSSLQLSEEKYRKIVEEAGDVVYSSDYKGYFTYVNPMSKKLTGYKENELIGKHFLEFIDPEWKEKVAAFYKEQFDNRIKETLFSFPIITKSGEKKWVEQTIIQQLLGDRVKGYQAIVRDITKRKKIEEEIKQKSEELQLSNKDLKERTLELETVNKKLEANSNQLKASEKQFRGLLESAPDAIVIVNQQGVIQLINAQTEKLFLYKREELVGQKVEVLVPQPFSGNHLNLREKYMEDPKAREMGVGLKLFAKKKNGLEFPVEIGLSPLNTAEGVFVFANIRDITLRKKAEAEIQQKSEELARSNQELEQFAYVASHDLQEPLRTISNFVGLLDKKYSGKTEEDTKEYFKFIVKATSKMQNLIKDLLDYSRVGRNITYATVDCNIIFKEVIAELDASIKESNAKISSAILPVLIGNDIRLKQLFQNLLSNAIKFRKKDVSPEIAITVEEKDTEYLFAIKDNGIGIEERYINKLFVIFQRLHSDAEYPGTGIGLATCKKIVDLHGGKIWVESKLGEGSAFYFTLPKEKLKAAAILPASTNDQDKLGVDKIK